MGMNSLIQWTDHTFNPWIGCMHVSPGCDHCYAERDWDHRFHRVEWGPHGERKRTSVSYWKNPFGWAHTINGGRPRVFCASLSDWLECREFHNPRLEWMSRHHEDFICYRYDGLRWAIEVLGGLLSEQRADDVSMAVGYGRALEYAIERLKAELATVAALELVEIDNKPPHDRDGYFI